MMLESSDGDGIGLNILVIQLNRYAEPLDDNYREYIDLAQCSHDAASLGDYVSTLIAETGNEVTLEVDANWIDISHPSGRSLDVRVFGTEAMDAVYHPHTDDEFVPDQPLMVFYSQLDRSGASFLVERFVRDGMIDISEATKDGQD